MKIMNNTWGTVEKMARDRQKWRTALLLPYKQLHVYSSSLKTWKNRSYWEGYDDKMLDCTATSAYL
jgi:hypothetical protein